MQTDRIDTRILGYFAAWAGGNSGPGAGWWAPVTGNPALILGALAVIALHIPSIIKCTCGSGNTTTHDSHPPGASHQ